jgi:hypothetical protein
VRGTHEAGDGVTHAWFAPADPQLPGLRSTVASAWAFASIGMFWFQSVHQSSGAVASALSCEFPAENLAVVPLTTVICHGGGVAEHSLIQTLPDVDATPFFVFCERATNGPSAGKSWAKVLRFGWVCHANEKRPRFRGLFSSGGRI